MITFKNGQLSKKEIQAVQFLLEEISDSYRDFYITRNNLRLFIRENTDLLYNILKQGDKIAYGNEGVALVTGFSDNSSRKYVKILSKDEESANRLLKILLSHIKCDLWIKVKKDNPLKKVLENNNFKYFGNRGREVLLYRKENDIKEK